MVIPAAGHAVNIDQPQAFIDAVLPFLDGLDAARRNGRPRQRHSPLALSLIAGSSTPPPRSNYADRRPLPAAFHRNAVEQHAAGSAWTPQEAAQALGTLLNYVRGRPGEEIFLAFRNIGGSGLFYKKDRLFLQFRKGRLAGWKGDWGHNWMWQ